MKQVKGTAGAAQDGKRVVSRMDAVALMLASAVAAVATTAATIAGIIDSFTGPVTLALPLAARHQGLADLRLGAEAYYTAVEASIPGLPAAEAVLLAWADALSQVSILAVLSLVFLLAFRLRGENLFTAGSAAIIGACGIVLAVAGTVGQLLDQAARSRLAEAIGANRQGAEESIIFTANLNLAPSVAGCVLVLVAAAFRYGRCLQKDTEGLI